MNLFDQENNMVLATLSATSWSLFIFVIVVFIDLMLRNSMVDLWRTAYTAR
jgi:hypothetical protein